MAERKKTYRLYNVYNNKTDEPIAIAATADGAAHALGISTEQFRCIYSRQFNKWHIEAIPVTAEERREALKQELKERGDKMPKREHTPRTLTYGGKTQTIKEWAAETGLPDRLIYGRKVELGWEDERTLTTPILQRGKWNRKGVKNAT